MRLFSFLAAILLASPAIAAPEDPIVSSQADLKAGQAAESALPVNAAPQTRLDLLSHQIAAASFAERADLAAEIFARAEAELQKGAKPPADGSLHAWAAIAFANLGNREKADRALAEAQRLIAAGSQSESGAAALVEAARGVVAWGRDDLPGSVASHEKALALARKHLNANDVRILWYEQLYVSRLILKDPLAGIAATREAERHLVGRLPEAHLLWVSQLNNQISADQLRGRFRDAARLGGRLVDMIGRVHGQQDYRLFSALQNQAIAHASLGLLGEAEAQTRAAFAIAEANPNRIVFHEVAMNHDLLGTFLLYSRRPAEAAVAFRDGLAKLKGLDKDDIRWPYIEFHLARALSLSGKFAEGAEIARRNVPLLRAKFPADHPNMNEVEVVNALIEDRAGNGASGYAMLKPMADKAAERILDVFVRERELTSITTNAKSIFEGQAAIALGQGQLEDGWRAAQLSGLSELGAASARIRYPGDDGRFAALLADITSARKNEARARAAMTGAGSAADKGALEAALLAASALTDRLEAKLEADFSAYRDVLRPRPLSLAEARKAVGPDAAYIIALTNEDRTLVLAMTSEGLVWDQTRGPWYELTKLAGAVRTSLDEGVASPGRPFDSAAAQRLYGLIFTDRIREGIKGKKHLIFPSSGPLARIPPAVLQAPPKRRGERPRWLIEDFAVSNSASLGSGGPSREIAPDGFMGVGDPALSPLQADGRNALRASSINLSDIRSLPSLPNAGAELAAMSEALGRQNSLLLRGSDASETKLKASRLSGYRIIAFATHGLVSGEVPGLDEPALVLTPPEKPLPDDDGLLRASEVSELKLAADWVILSACNTGEGDAPFRPTYSGLARAFRLAGARSVLLSHWPVRDDVAGKLTVGTVAGAAGGLPRSQALRRVQLSLLKDRKTPGASHPSIWAPIVIIDD